MNNPENRRSFFKKAGALLGAFSVNSLFHQLHAATWKEAFRSFEGWTPQELASNEDYWANKAKEIPGVKIHTSLKAAYSCALAGVSIKGMNPVELSSKLFSDYKIHTTAIALENIHCVRVSPHVYTKLADLDRLVEALEKIASKV
ncbi:hypothetical protein [Cecembia calidifontis]|jgi:selenocysteine lyase/cysteine desulfurase|uniref:hypothetical protein n=1 Tax=Cecembia calidifontis TaxID=1187080 RepID=UPI001F5F0C37|nr:hypothetical protein [Cecembia calidifontis]